MRNTGVSGKASRPGTVDLPAQTRFQVKATGADARELDSERKILEQIAEGLPPDASGRIQLFSELPVCDSCVGVIEQFRRDFPNIELIVTHGPKG